MKKIYFLFVFSFTVVIACSQIIIEDLRDRPETRYLLAYSDRFVDKNKVSGYYFIIDDGKHDTQNTVDSIKNNYSILDSSFYLKYYKGGTVSFNSPVDFLTTMYHYGWELMCDQSYQAKKVDKELPLSRNKNSNINVFILKRIER